MKQKTKNKKQSKKKLEVKKLFLLYGIGFLLGFQMALVLYVLSTFLKERSGFDNVGIFYVLGYLLALFLLLKLHQLVKRYGKSKLFLFFLFFKSFSLLGMALFFSHQMSLIFGVFSLTSGALMWACLDLILENYSKDKTTGRTRGAYLTALNTGILVAPFLATWIIATFGYRQLFLVSAGLTGLATVITWIFFRNINHEHGKDLQVKGVLKKIFKNKNLAGIYCISLLLELFYAIAVVYTPLYLIQLGLSWNEIGKIFTVMLIPFVIVQYPLGIVADKKTGEKEWLGTALVISGVSTAMISFVASGNVLLWMFILFMTRVGAAIIELMRDSYFFKNVGAQDVDIIDYFRTTRSVAYILGMTLSGIFLLFFDMKYIFLFLAVLLLSGLVPLGKLKDTK